MLNRLSPYTKLFKCIFYHPWNFPFKEFLWPLINCYKSEWRSCGIMFLLRIWKYRHRLHDLHNMWDDITRRKEIWVHILGSLPGIPEAKIFKWWLASPNSEFLPGHFLKPWKAIKPNLWKRDLSKVWFRVKTAHFPAGLITKTSGSIGIGQILGQKQ